MQFKGFPRSLQEAGAMLLAHEIETGYKVCPLASNQTRISRHYGPEGGFAILEGDKPIVIFYGDGSGRIKVLTHGSVSIGRVCRINAALPQGYAIRKAPRCGYELMRKGERIERFSNSHIFTPEAATAQVAA